MFSWQELYQKVRGEDNFSSHCREDQLDRLVICANLFLKRQSVLNLWVEYRENCKSESGQTREPRRTHTHFLDQNLESFAHAFRKNEGFEMQARSDALSLVHSFVV